MEGLTDTLAEFVELRDAIERADKQHKEYMKPFRERKEELEGLLLGMLVEAKLQNASTDTHTVYRKGKKSATIADGGAFRKFVIDNDEYDLVDWRANAPAVADFIKDNGATPPGVNYSVTQIVGVQKK